LATLYLPRDFERENAMEKTSFYSALDDSLNVAQHPASAHLKELSTLFCNDLLNLATLASRLLWYGGETPDLWRSHELVSVGVDVASYFVMLQSACDIRSGGPHTISTSRA
jgi:hypothetical protein